MASIAKRGAAILAALVGLVILTLTLVGWNWLRGPVSWVVSHKIGRPFAIRGDLRVDWRGHWGREPRITADRLVLANAPWGSAPDMLEIGRLSVTVDARQLLRGQIVLPEVEVSRPSVLLERSDGGEGNWPAAPAGATGAGPSRTPTLGRVRLDGGVVRYQDHSAGTEIRLELATPRPASVEEQVVEVRAQGQVAGRPFSVRRLEATLGPELSLVADGIVLANASWGSRPLMAQIERAAVRLDLARLLAGQVVVRALDLSEPNVLLETSRDGRRSNWTVAPTPAPGGASPSRGSAGGAMDGTDGALAALLGRLEVRNGTLAYRDPRTNTDVTVTVDRVGPERRGTGTTMGVTGRGRYRGATFALAGRVGTLLAIRDQRVPYPIDLTVQVGDTRAKLQGTLMAPLELRGLNVDLALEGQDLSKLYPFIPVPLPETPPYRLAGRLERTGQTWSFSGFQGQVGDSDLGGDFSVDLAGRRPTLKGDLVSHTLDFHDLAPLVGAPPSPQGTASAQQQQRAAARAGRDRVLPDEPFRLERLRAADADVTFRGERLVAPGLPLESLAARFRLADGRLRLDPLAVGVAGGTVAGSVLMDGGHEPLSSAVELSVREIDLQRLFPGFKLSAASAGLVGGAGRLDATGNSVAEMLGSMTGDVVLRMDGGRVSKLLLELADLDVADSAVLWVAGDKSIPVRCLVADFHADDGRMQTQTLVLDSQDTRVDGSGTIDFKNEGLGLRLAARSKRPSLVALRGPIQLGGRFKAPTVRVDATQVTLRAVAAAALGVLLTPPAAILPFIELGVAKDADCAGLAARAEARVRAAGLPGGADGTPGPAVTMSPGRQAGGSAY
jgi:uncharacterized protein involved in outer membrane biogenesis